MELLWVLLLTLVACSMSAWSHDHSSMHQAGRHSQERMPYQQTYTDEFVSRSSSSQHGSSASDATASSRGRALQQHKRMVYQPFPPGTPTCRPLARELVSEHANPLNVIMVTTMDKLVAPTFARSWIESVRAAGISYWLIGACDPWTSQYLGSQNITQCFNVPPKLMKYRGMEESYNWGGDHWHQATWNKVHVMREVYGMGFHVIHSDVDVTWFKDPMPWFGQFVALPPGTPPHVLFTTDATDTKNGPEDRSLELMTSPWIGINTGVYLMRQFPHGLDFFNAWLAWQDKNTGHDQDALNTVVRGVHSKGDKNMSEPRWTEGELFMYAALSNRTGVALMPVSMLGNAYTLVASRPHQLLNHTLYATHWVWTAGSQESKLHAMRDAMAYYDEPSYYNSPDLMLMTFGLDSLEAWPGYNDEPWQRTEYMVQFHLANVNWQLQQAYWGIMGALALNRTLVLPRFRCYCARHWYQTEVCRINERYTRFPFTCSLNDVMRVRRVMAGFKVQAGSYRAKIYTREYSFLENANTPQEIKASRAVVVPSPQPRALGQPVNESMVLSSTLPNGTVQLVVPWPLNTRELATLLRPVAHVRVLHLANATQLLSGRGFADAAVHRAYDEAIQKYKARWCCRSPEDMQAFNKTMAEQFEILPPNRRLPH